MDPSGEPASSTTEQQQDEDAIDDPYYLGMLQSLEEQRHSGKGDKSPPCFHKFVFQCTKYGQILLAWPELTKNPSRGLRPCLRS
eukprot:5659435-Amphidinium_carterae.1